MKAFWTILAIAGGLVLLVLIGVAIAVWTVDVNQFVGPVQAKVKDATGRDLAIAGGVKLSLGLEPKIVFDDVHFGNATWAKGKDFATVKRVEADVALLPLLQRRFEVVRLTLVEPTITLETGPGGKVNWDFGGGGTAPPPGAASAGAASVLASFGIGQLEIENGTVTYRDDASGSTTRVVIDRFVAQARTPTSPINAEFKGSVDDVPIALSGNLGPLDALLARRSPYPVTVEGQVAGRKTNLGAKLQFAEDTTRLEDLGVGIGSSKATGEATVAVGTGKKVTLRLSAPSIALADLKLPPRDGASAAPATRGPEPAPAKKGWIFSDEPVSFVGLSGSDVDGDITIGELKLEDGRKLSDVHARFTLRDAKLDAPQLQAKTMGGAVNGSLKIDATHAAEPTLALVAQASGLDLGMLLAAGGSPRQVKGGKTDVTINVTTRGTSERQWAQHASGNVLAVVGPAQVANSKETESDLGKIAQAVNPFRGAQTETELKCVVVRLPLHDGIAHIDHSIAAETRELGVLASGTIDFRNETLDLSVTPRTRVALPVDVPQLASLVRVHGALASPAVTVDARAAAATIATLGAAASKGGLAAVGAALAAKPGAASGGPDPCDVALGKAPPPTAAAAAGAAPAPGAVRIPANQDELNKALGKLLGR